MLRVAVTGNIGTGKTSICRILESLGVPVYYADREAKKHYRDPSVENAVKLLFGNNAYTSKGEPDTGFLADIVFSDNQKLEQLNAIIHPLVLDDYLQWSEKRNTYPYTVYESALLFESGFYRHFDMTILVTAPAELAKKRVLSRDGMDESEYLRRKAVQMAQEEKEKLADLILQNDETTALIPRIIKLHRKLISE